MDRTRKFRRSRENRRLGGVCGGIAEWLSIDVVLVRVLFTLSILFSFTLTLWIYLLLWIVVPAKPKSTVARVSHRLRRRFRALQRHAAPLNESASPDVCRRVQQLVAAVEALLPELEPANLQRYPELQEVRMMALEQLPQVLESHARLGSLAAESQLLAELQRFDDAVQDAVSHCHARRIGARGEGVEYSAKSRAMQVQLTALERRMSGRLTPAAVARVRRIRDTALAVMERLGDGLEHARLEHTVEKTALEYLPTALDEYLSLSPEFSTTKLLTHDKTAEQVLLDQLDLMDHSLLEVLQSLQENDARGLLAHGRFLQEKFGQFHHPFDD